MPKDWSAVYYLSTMDDVTQKRALNWLDKFLIAVDADAADATGAYLRTEMLAAAAVLLLNYPKRDGVDVSCGCSWGEMRTLHGL